MQWTYALLPSVTWLTLPYIFHITSQWHDFRKMFLNIKCLFWFSPQSLSQTFLILRRTERYMIKNTLVFMLKYPLSLSDFNVLGFSRLIFEKYSNIKSHENPSSVSHVVPCERTDRRTDWHAEAKSRFSQFCKRTLNSACYNEES